MNSGLFGYWNDSFPVSGFGTQLHMKMLDVKDLINTLINFFEGKKNKRADMPFKYIALFQTLQIFNRSQIGQYIV